MHFESTAGKVFFFLDKAGKVCLIPNKTNRGGWDPHVGEEKTRNTGKETRGREFGCEKVKEMKRW